MFNSCDSAAEFISKDGGILMVGIIGERAQILVQFPARPDEDIASSNLLLKHTGDAVNHLLLL